jgi:hypothetical protein
MRRSTIGLISLAGCLSLGLIAGSLASAQQPRDDGPPPRAEREGDRPPPPPPPPGKGGPPRPRDGDALPPGKAAPGPLPWMDDNKLPSLEGLFNRYDRNRNGTLEASEWDGLRDPERIDVNADGEITLAEFMAHTDGPRRGEAGGRGEFGGRGQRGGFGGGGFGGRGGGFGGMMPGAGPFGEPAGDDPEMRELVKQDVDLDRQAHEMAMRVRNSRGEDRNKLKAELAEVVNKHFDVRQKRRELQLKRMEEELKRLREAIGERNESRSTIVGNRLQELIGESRNLDF